MKAHAAAIIMSALPAALAAQKTPGTPPQDPFVWLEEVDGTRAMEWVEKQNARTVRELQASIHYKPIVDRLMTVMDSEDRIPYPVIRGEYIYNFWQDAQNPRGLYRRTSWKSYATPDPQWETVLDIDALATAENVPWSLAGFNCLEPGHR
jgi:prolyl oligopeptidase